MKSIWSTLSTIIIVGAIVGGGVYYYFSQQLWQQKNELADEINTVKSKVSEVEKNTSQAVEEIKNQKKEEPAVTAAAEPAAAPATQTPSSTPVASPTPINTADWKTFTSTKYKYSVKYPADWVYKDTTGGVAMSTISFRPKSGKEEYPFGVSVEKSNLDYSIALQKKQYESAYTFKNKTTKEINTQTFTILNFESKTDSNIKPTVYMITQKDPDSDKDFVYYFSEGATADTALAGTISSIAASFQLSK